MLVFLPLVGLMIGFLWCLLFWLIAYFPIPLQLKAAFLAIYPFFITGFIHLDGFMDTQDALLSRRPLADKLRILKDPNCGAFSVISLVILFLLQFAAMWALVEGSLEPEALWKNSGYFLTFMLIPFFSRSGSALAIFTLKPLGHSQYKEGEEKAGKKAYVIAVALMNLIFLSLFCLITGLQGSFEYKALLVLLLVMGSCKAAIRWGFRGSGRLCTDHSGNRCNHSHGNFDDVGSLWDDGHRDD